MSMKFGVVALAVAGVVAGCSNAPAPSKPETAKERVFAKLKAVAASPNYYWAWTQPWLRHWGWAGDLTHVIEENGTFRPKLRLMTAFADARGKVNSISETGGEKKRDDFWVWLHRVATAEGVKVAFVDTWSGKCGTLPATEASERDECAFAARPQVLMEGSGYGF